MSRERDNSKYSSGRSDEKIYTDERSRSHDRSYDRRDRREQHSYNPNYVGIVPYPAYFDVTTSFFNFFLFQFFFFFIKKIISTALYAKTDADDNSWNKTCDAATFATRCIPAHDVCVSTVKIYGYSTKLLQKHETTQSK